MPTYTYECRICADTQEGVRTVAMRHDAPSHCGVYMRLIIVPGYVINDIAPYYDDNLQCGIRSRQHRQEVMREQGVYDRRDFKGHKWNGK